GFDSIDLLSLICKLGAAFCFFKVRAADGVYLYEDSTSRFIPVSCLYSFEYKLTMFLIILVILRLSGRRGVRQLTVFEVAIIISLGSAAGDPMFQEDIPIFYAIIVFICVICVYKIITWLTSKSEKITQLLEGKVLPVVKDGVFDIKHENDNTFSRMEFFSELRNLNVEHLGQVKEGVLEIDGTLSVLFYPDEEVKYGLPLFPSSYKSVDIRTSEGPFACMY